MNEEKTIASAKAGAVKKAKIKTARKARAKKPPFGLNDDLNIAPARPEAGFKIEKKPLASKSGEPKNSYRKIAFSFIVLTLLLVAAVLYFGLAKLTIVIIPAQEKITDSSTIEVLDNEAGAALAALGQDQIYGVVKQVPVELSREFSASGKEILGEEVAGKVTIINDYIKNQPLVATTRLLSSDNKLFRLKNTVNVPAGGRVEAEIYADTAKPEMAVGPGKFTIPGLWAGLQDKIYAQSQAPMAYSQKVKYIIGQSDIDNAVSQLKNDLLANAKSQVEEAYRDYDQSIFAVDNNSVTQEVNGKVGEAKEKFTIKMKTMVTVVAFNDDEIYNQIKAKLAAALADDKEVSKFDKQDMSYALASFDISRGSAMVNIDSMAQAALKDSAKIIKKNNLTGLDYEQLKTYLNGLPEVAGYQIDFFPSFVKKAPNLVDRIEIEIKK
ncbi:MAG: hypothetical protein WCV70_00405 [Patescibacteria group bacterium]|jgi:hypothetical protein